MNTEGPDRPLYYGRRRGRKLRQRRSQLLDQVLPATAIPVPPRGTMLEPAALFEPRPASVWLEIGFGSGEHLADQAASHPHVGIIGCEPFLNGVSALLGMVEERALSNVRILPEDARLLLPALPDQSIDRCFVLFADPWPKKRHHERRFIGPANLDTLARVLAPGAELRVASDEPGLIRWMLEHTWRHPAFEWLARRAEDWRRRPADWPPTRYEQKALQVGRTPVFLRFRRRAAPSGGDVGGGGRDIG